MNLENPYRAAGTFTGCSYVERQADRDLCQAIETNLRYPYILAPRQSGKSSLIAHARAKMSAKTCVSGFVDFSTFLPSELSDFDMFLARFFEECFFSLGSACTFTLASGRFLEGIGFLLRQTCGKRVVLFLDEVDALQRSGFRDTFFSIIRNVFNERAVHQKLRKLQFVIAGAARAEELITDELRSPFNVGKAIQLNDISLKETEKVCSFMSRAGVEMPADLATLIFQNANGSVYLTQLLLEHLWERVISRSIEPLSTEAVTRLLRDIVEETVRTASSNVHFTTILANLERHENAQKVFTRLLRRELITESEHEMLRFFGIAGVDRTTAFRNRIYEMVFGADGSLCQRGMSPATVEYLRRLENSTSKLSLIGLGHGVQIELPIQDAYIPLNVVLTRDLRQRKVGRFEEKSLREMDQCEAQVELSDIFVWAAKFDQRGVLLLGDPGAGKTTGARQFCWRLLSEPKAATLGLPAETIPVFLRLRELTPALLDQGLTAFIVQTVAAPTLPDPGPDLLARRRVLWVFDGLDEVVHEAARVRVCQWIARALEDRPDDYFLVTSRYQGYQGDVELGPAFLQFHVKPLNPGQVRAFVEHWYRAVYRKLHGPDPAAQEKVDETVQSLLELIGQPEYRIGRLRELPANPLLLTILCLVHQQDRNLPRRRADLYAKCVRVLVEHWRRQWRREHGLAGFDPEAAEGVLGALAWWLQREENRVSRTVEELGAVAAKALADLAPGCGLGRDGVEFIRRMRDETGILAMYGSGQCGFLHLTFQEYLAGYHAARVGQAEVLAESVGRSWWRETILVALAVGAKPFAQAFFTALLRTDALTAQASCVDQCLAEARYTVLEPFLEALKLPVTSEAIVSRKVEILRRLRCFDSPELVAVCRPLSGEPYTELSSLAREIVARSKAGGGQGEKPSLGAIEAPQPGEVHIDPRTRLAFVVIPAGEFDMGSNDGLERERPIHRVRISSFLLGRYPVTNEEYEQFLEANPSCVPPAHWNDSQFNDSQQPVVGVSWNEAQAFCQWARCRLPTEAEWEYACRAGTTTRFCFGDEEKGLSDYAWFAENSDGRTHPVGQKQPNSWGLYDIHGNVWEWCQDWFAQDCYRRSPKDNPQGPEKGGYRVLRGGCWIAPGEYCRSAFRYDYPPARRILDFGFRVVLAPGQFPKSQPGSGA